MAESELVSKTPPLAWDDEGMPFAPPSEAVGWRVRESTGKPGRPGAVWDEHGIIHMGLHDDMERLRCALQGRTGSFRLYPVDRFGRELEPAAMIEVLPESGHPTMRLATTSPSSLESAADVGAARVSANAAAMIEAEAARARSMIPLRFFDLYERMQTSRDAHDALLGNLLTTLVTTTSTIQQSTAGLLNAANTTVKVATGVEALDRQAIAAAPAATAAMNIGELTDNLSALGTLKETLNVFGRDDKPAMPWFVQLLNGPAGMGLMSMLSSMAQTVMQAHAAQFEAQQADEEEESE